MFLLLVKEEELGKIDVVSALIFLPDFSNAVVLMTTSFVWFLPIFFGLFLFVFVFVLVVF